MDLKVKLIDEWAKLPEKAGANEAGFDLCASWPATVRRGTVTKVRTGVCVEIPADYFGLVCDRGGLGSRGFTVLGGVVDNTYRGEIIVLLAYVAKPESDILPTETPFDGYRDIEAGDKVAQLVLIPQPYFRALQVETLSSSVRGERRFGSTDLNPLGV